MLNLSKSGNKNFRQKEQGLPMSLEQTLQGPPDMLYNGVLM